MNVADICVTNIVYMSSYMPRNKRTNKKKKQQQLKQSSLEYPDSVLSLATVASFNKLLGYGKYCNGCRG